MNPDYQHGEDGGELRLYTNEKEVIDVTPDGGRMVMFWSDEIPHEVLPTYCPPTAAATGSTTTTTTTSSSSFDDKDRYALTVWIPTENIQVIHNPSSKFSSLGDDVFPSTTTTTTT